MTPEQFMSLYSDSVKSILPFKTQNGYKNLPLIQVQSERGLIPSLYGDLQYPKYYIETHDSIQGCPKGIEIVREGIPTRSIYLPDYNLCTRKSTFRQYRNARLSVRQLSLSDIDLIADYKVRNNKRWGNKVRSPEYLKDSIVLSFNLGNTFYLIEDCKGNSSVRELCFHESVCHSVVTYCDVYSSNFGSVGIMWSIDLAKSMGMHYLNLGADFYAYKSQWTDQIVYFKGLKYSESSND